MRFQFKIQKMLFQTYQDITKQKSILRTHFLKNRQKKFIFKIVILVFFQSCDTKLFDPFTLRKDPVVDIQALC